MDDHSSIFRIYGVERTRLLLLCLLRERRRPSADGLMARSNSVMVVALGALDRVMMKRMLSALAYNMII
jgi:hypothetical protein